jgi:hypothetical protein
MSNLSKIKKFCLKSIKAEEADYEESKDMAYCHRADVFREVLSKIEKIEKKAQEVKAAKYSYTPPPRVMPTEYACDNRASSGVDDKPMRWLTTGD